MAADDAGSTAVSPRSNITLAASTTPQDAFDKDDFDAVAYINEMFPTGLLALSDLASLCLGLFCIRSLCCWTL